MKKWGFLIIVFLWAVSGAFSGSLEVKKKAGEYEVKIEIDKNPPVLGKNIIEIEIKDAAGAAVTDAKVLINYYMPPMPRMAPMNYKIEAERKDQRYRAKMVLIMSGPWIIAVKITRENKNTTAKFNIDVR